jgi:hypothetical protein
MSSVPVVLSLLAAAMNLAAIALFVVACCAPTLERVRHVEGWALSAVALTALLVASSLATAIVDAVSWLAPGNADGVFSIALLVSQELGVLALPISLVIPLTAWLGVVMLRRSRAPEP